MAKRPGDGHALALAADSVAGLRSIRAPMPSSSTNCSTATSRLRDRGAPQAIVDVAAHVEVIEQLRILKHVAQRPLVWGRQMGGRLAPHRFAHLAMHAPSPGGVFQPGHGTQAGGLAAA